MHHAKVRTQLPKKDLTLELTACREIITVQAGQCGNSSQYPALSLLLTFYPIQNQRTDNEKLVANSGNNFAKNTALAKTAI